MGSLKMEGLGILGIYGYYEYCGYCGYFIFTQYTQYTQYTHLAQYTQYTQIYPRGTCTHCHQIKQKQMTKGHLLCILKVSRDTGIRTRGLQLPKLAR